MKRLLLFIGLVSLTNTAYAAPTARYDRTIIPETTSTYDLGTSLKTWLTGYFDNICLGGVCKSAWPTGGGGSGGGTFSTSTAWGSILYNFPNNLTDILSIGYDGSGVATSSDAEFVVDPTAKLALFLNSTKVGIGTTSPYAPLSVVGQIVGGYFTATTSTASTFPLANITKLSNLTSNGFVKTGSGDGTLSVDTNSYLTGSGAGVTSVSVASSNGLAGSSSGGATPTLTLSTSITGVLKGDGTAISAAANGTDYTLIAATTCGGTDKVSAISASGVVTCSADSGGGATGDSVWSRNATTRLVYTPTTTDPVAIGVTSTSTAATFMVDPYLGLVGIGTSSPSRKAKLDVVGDAIIGNENYQGQDIYLMAGFRGDDDKKIFLQASADGKTWKQLSSSPVFSTTTGGTRDPRILYYNGTYYMSYTNVTFGQTNSTFTILSSPDLLNWSIYARPSLAAVSGVTNVWSPNFYQDTDGSVHIFVDVSTAGESGPWALYELHPSTDGDLSSWSTPVAVTGLPANTLDGNVQYRDSNGVYYLWYKEETTKYTEYATSTNLTGPYTVAKSGNWAGWGADLEGISLMNIGGGKWRIYFDKYTLNGIYYSESSDNWATWTAKALITTPFTVSNPGISRFRNVSVARNIESAYIQNSPISYTSTGHGYLSSTTANFGIGTASPTQKLHVAGNEYISGTLGVGATSPIADLSIEGTQGLSIKHTSATTPLFLYANSVGSAGLASNVSPANAVTDITKPQWVAVLSQSSDSFAVYRSPAGATWSPVASLYVANTGNIGFGTTSPYAKVSVVGEVVGANFTATTTASSTLPNLVTTNLRVTGKLYDSSNSAGTSGYVLQTNGTGAQWVATSTLGLGGSGGGSVISVDGSGGTTGLSLTGGPITSSGTLTLGGILNINNGGTGTSTAPTYGKLLVGNALGTYDLLATSSLGISGGSVSGGTAGMLASWTNSTTLTATGTPTAASYVATSSTATSTFAGGLTVGGFTGIGTTTPLNKLQISADSTGTYPSDYGVGQLAITGRTDARKRVGMLLDSTNNWFSMQAGQYGVTTYPIKLNPQGGKVGINDGSTVAPTYRLTGGSPSSALNTFLSSAPSAFVNSTSDNGTTFAGEYTGASGAGSGSFITLQSNDGAALSSGDRFAGFNFGGYNGSASLNSGAVTAWASENWTSSSMPTEIRFENTASGATSRTTNMVIASTGNIGMASSTPWRKLSVVGTVAINGLTSSTAGNAVCILTTFDVVNAGNTTCATSARDTKKNITDLSPIEVNNIILGLKPVSFNYKESGERRVGFIAEDVAKVDTRLVEYAKDDVKFDAIGVTIKKGDPISVQYANLTSILTKFVQGFYSEFQSLVARVSGLEKRLNEQDKRIKALEDKLSKIK